jgi:hypothetical protein
MDEAASRVNPYNLKRLEKARQRREDRAQTELQIKSRAESEQERVLQEARRKEEDMIKQRNDETDAIYQGMIGKSFHASSIEAEQKRVDWLKEAVVKQHRVVEAEEAKHKICVKEKLEARKHYQIYNRDRQMMTNIKQRVEKAILEHDEMVLEMETADGVIDRFGRDQESMIK